MAAAAAAADGRGRRYEVLIVAAAATAAAAAGTPSSAAGRTPSVRWFRENAPKPSPPSPSPRTTFSATERAARGPQWVERVVARVCGDPLTDHVSTSASYAVAWVPLPPPRRAGLMSLQRARARRAFQISSQHRLRSRSTSPALPVSPAPRSALTSRCRCWLVWLGWLKH